MRMRNYLIAGLTALCIVTLTEGKALTVQADGSTDMKSRGIFSFDNGTPEDTSDDMCFHSDDIILLEKRIKEIEGKIAETEERLNLSTTTESQGG
ncbi:MAG: hypothetical protein IJP31_11160 [Lachnospiraceae bacterium]|nr:hypothetical protein [Lachnospiraceae bacterium]